MSAARYARRGDTCLGKKTQNPPWLTLTVAGAYSHGSPLRKHAIKKLRHGKVPWSLKKMG